MVTKTIQKNPKTSDVGSLFKVKLEAHYPRLFLLADESDPFSRALVLRGLAVVNVSQEKQIVGNGTAKENMSTENIIPNLNWVDSRTTLSINAHLNSMESYINPNVSGALGPNRCSSDPQHPAYTGAEIHAKKSTSPLPPKMKRTHIIFDGQGAPSLGHSDQSKKKQQNDLGIALIEPVTAILDFNQIQRELHPTVRTISLQIEPVSTMISFEDVALIEAVARRWSTESNRATNKQEKMANMTNPKPAPSLTDFMEPSSASDEYEVVFHSQKLGLVLRKSGNEFVVDEVAKYSTGEIQVSVGDALISIEGNSTERLPFQSITQILADSPRPLTVKFLRKKLNHPFYSTAKSYSEGCGRMPQSHCSDSAMSTTSTDRNDNDDDNDIIAESLPQQNYDNRPFTISFAVGKPNGLVFQRGICGDVVVVNSVDFESFVTSASMATWGEALNQSFSECAMGDFMVTRKTNNLEGCLDEIEVVEKNENIRLRSPRPGAVILAVNGTHTTELGCRKTMDLIEKHNHGPEHERGVIYVDNDTESAVSDDLLHAPSDSSHGMHTSPTNISKPSLSKLSYTITFYEAMASEWASVDKVDIAIAGFKLSLINDINGRDMPVLRGSLSGLDIRLRRGFNLKTQFIKVDPPSILILGCDKMTTEGSESAGQGIGNPSVSGRSSSRLLPNWKRNHCGNANNSSFSLFPCSDLSELILKFRAQSSIEMEYYNARIALWEPIMEPCSLEMQLEWQKGNVRLDIPRPGNLAFFFSDHVSSRSNKVNHLTNELRTVKDNENKFVCINVTDAAIEMFAKTMHEFIDWRKLRAKDIAMEEVVAEVHDAITKKRVTSQATPPRPKKSFSSEKFTSPDGLLESSSQSQSGNKFPHSPHRSVSSPPRSSNACQIAGGRIAAQKAAAAALEFAKKRGAATQKKEETAKSFVFRNRTGVSIAFGPKMEERCTNRFGSVSGWADEGDDNGDVQKYNLHGYNKLDAKEVLDGCEARFHLDVIHEDSYTSSHSHNSTSLRPKVKSTQEDKRVRSYEGRFPDLWVALDPSFGVVDSLNDLPVTKVGMVVRNLRVIGSRKNLGKGNVFPQSIEHYFSTIAVVWTVQLENNRKILTLSSAVSFTSIACGISIDIGVRSTREDHEDVRNNDSIKSVGIAKPGSPCFLPIWLGLNGNDSIHVRPVAPVRHPNHEEIIPTPVRDFSVFVATAEWIREESSKEEKNSLDTNTYEWSEEGVMEFVLTEKTPKAASTCFPQPSQNISELFSSIPHKGIEMQEFHDQIQDLNLSQEMELRWKQLHGNELGFHDGEVSFGRACCLPVQEFDLHPLWLSCIGTTKASSSSNEHSGSLSENSIERGSSEKNEHNKRGRKSKKNSNSDAKKQLHISIGSNFTLRNLLPTSLEWEIANATPERLTNSASSRRGAGRKQLKILDGSSIRSRHLMRYGFTPWDSSSSSESQTEIPSSYTSGGHSPCLSGSSMETSLAANSSDAFFLHSGCGVEVFSCDPSCMSIHARFRCGGSDGNWSNWALLRLPDEKEPLTDHTSNDTEKSGTSEAGLHIHGHHITVQSDDGTGVPLTVGIKLFPKVLPSSDQPNVDSAGFGLDIILHAELWMRNLTNLPLIIGAPKNQIIQACKNSSFTEIDPALAAEAALMEIASVLDIGEKGFGLRDNIDNELCMGGQIYALPRQQSDEVYEEVFEYIEVENSTIKKRWWAGEKPDCSRPKPTFVRVPGGKNWQWEENETGETWKIDCSGQATAPNEGWESCRNLMGMGETTFTGIRTFDPTHPFRRRRWFRKRVQVKEKDAKGCQAARKPFENLAAGSESTCQDDNNDFTENVMFHQPVLNTDVHLSEETMRNIFFGQHSGDSFSRGNNNVKKNRSILDFALQSRVDGSIRLCLKCGDGRWSSPINIPPSGSGHGVIRVPASRWPRLSGGRVMSGAQTQKYGDDSFIHASHKGESPPAMGFSGGSISFDERGGPLTPTFSTPCLGPGIYDLSYHVSVLSGPWAEFSRLMMISPRLMIRNDSKRFDMDIKQVGVADDSALCIGIGEIVPFYWADYRLPELVCVRPSQGQQESGICSYRWTGGFDICQLGMIPLRVRADIKSTDNLSVNGNDITGIEVDSSDFLSSSGKNHCKSTCHPNLRTIRAHVEIRPGTGGTGITLSLREEDPLGEGSLFRIENRSPFPIWIAQDGVLANPTSFMNFQTGRSKTTPLKTTTELKMSMSLPTMRQRQKKPATTTPDINSIGGSLVGNATNVKIGRQDQDGDLIQPMENVAFGLDVPFRQGKYVGRRAALLTELLMLRISLAPLCSREGIESTKVIGLTTVGNVIRLNPSKLSFYLGDTISTELLSVRVLGIVCADGPTRVVRFCLMEKEVSAKVAISNAMRIHAKQGLEKMTDATTGLPFPVFESGLSFSSLSNFQQEHTYGAQTSIMNAAVKTLGLIQIQKLMNEEEACSQAYYGKEKWWSQSFEDYDFASEDEEEVEADDEFDKGLVSQGIVPVESEAESCDYFFFFKASFRGFVLSIVDSVPSEIAVASLRSVHAISNWNSKRTSDASASISIGWLQVDNHCPSAPFPVAVYPGENREKSNLDINTSNNWDKVKTKIIDDDFKQRPMLTVGLTFAPKHTTEIACLKSVTISPRDLNVSIDLAFIVRVQRFLLGLQSHLDHGMEDGTTSNVNNGELVDSELKESWPLPDLAKMFRDRERSVAAGIGSQKLYFANLTIFPCNVSLSVAPARSLSTAQAAHEGHEAAAVHAAVRKGDLLIGDGAGFLGVKTGVKNHTALAVVRGALKTILVDALLQCDAASLDFPGIALRNHITSGPQLATYLTAHYLAALRSNVPALLGSLAAFGNPIGLIRGLGDGMSDFVSEPIKGLRKSVEELNPSLFVDGVARGTGSLARHTVGGFADSASLLTETLSKNMAVLTLDRQYAIRRDLSSGRCAEGGKTNHFRRGGEKLWKGVLDGLTGVVQAPVRGAGERGVEGFAVGVGKGLLGLVIKPVIGLTDAATDVMIGVKDSIENGDLSLQRENRRTQLRPRRALYSEERALRVYNFSDATAAKVMLRTNLAGETYLSHLDIGDCEALLSVKRLLILDADNRERIMVKFKDIKSLEVSLVPRRYGGTQWGVLIFLKKPKLDLSEVEVASCNEKLMAVELCSQIKRGINLVGTDAK